MSDCKVCKKIEQEKKTGLLNSETYCYGRVHSLEIDNGKAEAERDLYKGLLIEMVAEVEDTRNRISPTDIYLAAKYYSLSSLLNKPEIQKLIKEEEDARRDQETI